MQESFAKIAEEHQKTIAKSFDAAHLEVLESISREILKAFKAGHQLFLCGNGGSAADSQHIAAEFVGRFHRERRSLPAVALTVDSSILTAVANDYSYDQVFSRQVEGLGRKGDILIAISTSGNSKNVLLAVEKAKELGMVTVGFTGQDGGQLKHVVDHCFHAASKNTPHIQEVHITALHAISEIVEEVFFGA